jgi:hypothetical protein
MTIIIIMIGIKPQNHHCETDESEREKDQDDDFFH